MSKKPKPTYRGYIVTDVQPEYSFQGQPQTRAQQLEIRKRDLPAIIGSLLKKPLRHLHHDYQVGEITGVIMDDDTSVQVEFQLNDDLVGGLMNEYIKAGILPSLSLKHNRETNEVEEVSLCVEGARQGTRIIGIPLLQPFPSPSAASASGEASSAPQSSSSSSVAASVTSNPFPLSAHTGREAESKLLQFKSLKVHPMSTPSVAASNSIGLPMDLVMQAFDKGIDPYQYVASKGVNVAPHEIRAAMEAIQYAKNAAAAGVQPGATTTALPTVPPVASPVVAATETDPNTARQASTPNAAAPSSATNDLGMADPEILEAAKTDPFVRMKVTRGELSAKDKEAMFNLHKQAIDRADFLERKVAELDKQEQVKNTAAAAMLVELLSMINNEDPLPTPQEKALFQQRLNEKGTPPMGMVYASLVAAKRNFSMQRGLPVIVPISNGVPPSMPPIVAASTSAVPAPATSASVSMDQAEADKIREYLRSRKAAASNVPAFYPPPTMAPPNAAVPMHVTASPVTMSTYASPIVSAKRTHDATSSAVSMDPIAAGLAHSGVVLSSTGLDHSIQSSLAARNDLLYEANKKARVETAEKKWTPVMQKFD